VIPKVVRTTAAHRWRATAADGIGLQAADPFDMSIPFPDSAFDAAVMPLVIFFVPVPAASVAEMARVVRPGGIVTAYAWDMPGGGFPYEALKAELRRIDVVIPEAPNVGASRIDVMRDLWTRAGPMSPHRHNRARV